MFFSKVALQEGQINPSFVYLCRLLGKVAADTSHKWVYNDQHSECEPSYIASWNASVEPVREVAIINRSDC